MTKTLRAGVLLVGVIVVTFAATGLTRADDSYAGIRLWDPGPYTTWSGIDATDTTRSIIVVKGATSSASLTYPVGTAAPQIQYLSGYVAISVGPAKKIRPVGPHQGFIMNCTAIGDVITCVCAASANDNVCDQSGTLSGSPTYGWHNVGPVLADDGPPE